MIVRTTNSIYAIDVAGERFRLLGSTCGAAVPVGEWQRYQQMGPVEVGRPITFGVLREEFESQALFSMATTSPVVEITAGDVLFATSS